MKITQPPLIFWKNERNFFFQPKIKINIRQLNLDKYSATEQNGANKTSFDFEENDK